MIDPNNHSGMDTLDEGRVVSTKGSPLDFDGEFPEKPLDEPLSTATQSGSLDADFDQQPKESGHSAGQPRDDKGRFIRVPDDDASPEEREEFAREAAASVAALAFTQRHSKDYAPTERNSKLLLQWLESQELPITDSSLEKAFTHLEGMLDKPGVREMTPQPQKPRQARSNLADRSPYLPEESAPLDRDEFRDKVMSLPLQQARDLVNGEIYRRTPREEREARSRARRLAENLPFNRPSRTVS